MVPLFPVLVGVLLVVVNQGPELQRVFALGPENVVAPAKDILRIDRSQCSCIAEVGDGVTLIGHMELTLPRTRIAVP